MKQIFIVALLATGLYVQSCKKQNAVLTAQTDMVTNAAPMGTAIYGPNVEWAFGNAENEHLPCIIKYATCGVQVPQSPFPESMNRLSSAPGEIIAGNNQLEINIDGTQLDPVIYNQALAGHPFLFSHPVTLPQSAVNAACQLAGVTPPLAVTISAGAYFTVTPGIPWINPGPQPAVIIVEPNTTPAPYRVKLVIRFR